MTDNFARILAVLAMVMALANEVVQYHDYVQFKERIAALEARK